MEKADVGLIGLAVMGQNLVLNLADHGYKVAVYNRTTEKTKIFMEGEAKDKNIIPAYTLEEFVDSLARPRKVMLMVKAGPAVDAVIGQVAPLLEPGDLIIDGGNSYFSDTTARENRLSQMGLLYAGVGISGGEEGARNGPSIMPGGSKAAWGSMGKMLMDISAKAEDGKPCCAYLGPNGAGHFVKMVHNGIEYGDMQLTAEAYLLMRELLHMEAEEIGRIFSIWNEGELESYLVEITADILKTKDSETGNPLVDMILDEAQQKGTGKWTSQEALNLGVPAPTISEAVFARYISAMKDERTRASELLKGPKDHFEGSKDILIDRIRSAMYAAKICSYAQGFAVLKTASQCYEWDLDLGTIARIWRNGCIIRAQFLNRITDAYEKDADLDNLLLDKYFKETITGSQSSWREVVGLAVRHGIPVPGFSSALAYYDSYRSKRLPANLTQAQRDYFGAHTYKRVDIPGVFHTEWTGGGTDKD